MDVPVTPSPTASTVPAASKPSTALGGSGMSLERPARGGEIGRADAGGLDLYPDLSLTRIPQRDPGPLQHLRRSVPGHHCDGSGKVTSPHPWLLTIGVPGYPIRTKRPDLEAKSRR